MRENNSEISLYYFIAVSLHNNSSEKKSAQGKTRKLNFLLI